MVVTTDVYTYIGVVAEVLNEGLPRASWLIIGDRVEQIHLCKVQSFLHSDHCPEHTRIDHVDRVRWCGKTIRQRFCAYRGASSFPDLYSHICILGSVVSVETAVSTSTRALDKPDVPLIISTVKFLINIVLDLLIISKVHVGNFTPTVNMQAATQLACNMAAAVFGLAYFCFVIFRTDRQRVMTHQYDPVRPSLACLKTLARPGALTFAESAIRNALYLWLVNGIVAMGSDYATAWGVFSSIRWGLIMVPVQALEATTLAFIGHSWGEWRKETGTERRPRASRHKLYEIIRPALWSCLIALAVETPLCIFMSEYGARRFAFYLSESHTVSQITAKMWRTIDWCYIFYALSTQLAAILLATRPRWYLYQSLISNLLWVMPWAIVVSKAHITPEDAWTYHSIVFGGSLVFSFFDVLVVDLVWAWALLRGTMRVPAIY
ncbi:hypothetical protein JADG_006549 [Aureobasidium aubasidani]|nr:hypothetical protein JADG_006549 [Aureobasidium pullulans]